MVPATVGTNYKWSFDPAPHFAPSPPSPIQSTVDRTRFLAVLGKWRIDRDDSAPSAPHVMKQERADGHASRILVELLGFKGVTAKTKCRLDGALDDASCGVVFGARAEDDYLVARIEDGHVRVLEVRGAVEQELATATMTTTRHQWHELAVSYRGGEVSVSVDGGVVVSAKLPEVGLGRIGLFARGDASFDDLSASATDRADL